MKREQIENIIIFVNTLTKTYYNKSHIALRLTRDNITYLRLHYEYEISDLVNRKLYYQRIDPFKILEKIKSLAYRLKLSSIIKIHFVVSIIQLKSVESNKWNTWLITNCKEHTMKMCRQDSNNFSSSTNLSYQLKGTHFNTLICSKYNSKNK